MRRVQSETNFKTQDRSPVFKKIHFTGETNESILIHLLFVSAPEEAFFDKFEYWNKAFKKPQACNFTKN